MNLIVMKVSLFTYYYIMYKICHKQYVGLTVDIFCSRWNFYKRNDGKYLVGELCLQEHINTYLSILKGRGEIIGSTL